MRATACSCFALSLTAPPPEVIVQTRPCFFSVGKSFGLEQVDSLQAHLGTCFAELIERKLAVAPPTGRLVDASVLDDPL